MNEPAPFRNVGATRQINLFLANLSFARVVPPGSFAIRTQMRSISDYGVKAALHNGALQNVSTTRGRDSAYRETASWLLS